MSSENTFDALFKALGDSRRRRMLDLLKEKPMTTGDLCSAFPQLNRCTVMQHLGVLEKANLIIVQRKGRQRWNYLNALPIKDVYDRWISGYATGAMNLLAEAQKKLEDR